MNAEMFSLAQSHESFTSTKSAATEGAPHDIVGKSNRF